MDEPRPVPRPMSIGRDQWYCLNCGFSANTEGYTKSHWKNTHGLEEDQDGYLGVDYCQGWQLFMMQGLRDEWVEEQAGLFAAALHPGFGPEDLLAEAEIGDA